MYRVVVLSPLIGLAACFHAVPAAVANPPSIEAEAPGPRPAACGPSKSGDPKVTLLGLVVGRELRLLKADGTWKVAFTFGASSGTSPENVVVNFAVRKGRFIAASAFLNAATFEQSSN